MSVSRAVAGSRSTQHKNMGITIEFILNTGESRVVHLLLEHYHWTGLYRLSKNQGNTLLCDLFAFEIKKTPAGTMEFSFLVASYMYKNLVKREKVVPLKRGERVFSASFAC